MNVKEKVYVVVDKDGLPCEVYGSRQLARLAKSGLNTSVLYPDRAPFSIVQYKRWKKVS